MATEFSHAEMGYIRRASSDFPPETLAKYINKMREETFEPDVSSKDVKVYLGQLAGRRKSSRRKRYAVFFSTSLAACALAGFYTYYSLNRFKPIEPDMINHPAGFGLELHDGVEWGIVQMGRKYIQIKDDPYNFREKAILKNTLEGIALNDGPNGKYAKMILDLGD